ncbi:MAG: YfhO family protein [Anaerolineae bacterium]
MAITLPRRTLKDICLVLLLLLLTLAFFWKIALTNLILVGLDIFTYFYPYRAYAAEVLLQGHLPLWNPYLFMGAPFLANIQTALFYPLNWPLYLLSVPKMVSWSIILHIFLAGLFSFCFARFSLKLGRCGALVTAATFAFSGFLGAQAEHVNQLSVSAWLPLLLLLFHLATRWSESSVEKSKVVGQRPALLLGGVVVAVQFLAGHAQSSFIVLSALGLAALTAVDRGSAGANCQFFKQPKAALRQFSRTHSSALLSNLLVWGLMVTIGFGLATVQLLPALELARLSVRGGGIPYRQAVSFSLDPRLVLRALLPTYGLDRPLFSEYVAYVGIIPLALAAVGALGPKGGRWRHFLLTLIFVALFLAVGAYNPFYLILYKLVPGFAIFRAPARWLLLYIFGVACLAGLGADFLASPLSVKAQLAAQNAAALTTWLLRRLAFATVTIAVPLALALPFLHRPRLGAGLAWLLPTAVAVVMILAGLKRRSSWPLYRVLLGLVVVVELFLAGRHLAYNRPTAPEAYSSLRPAIAHLLADKGLYRIISFSDLTFDPGDLAEMGDIFGGQLSPEALYDYVVSAKEKEILAPNLPLRYHLASVDGYDGGLLPLARFVELQRLFLPEDRVSLDGRLRERLTEVPPKRYLDLFNVKYVITDKIFDVWVDGVYYDLGLGGELGPSGPTSLTVNDLPSFPATSLGIVSYLSDAAMLPQGEAVAEVMIRAEGGQRRYLLRAGVDTAEGEYDVVAAYAPLRHDKAQVVHHWRGNRQGNEYHTLLSWAEPLILRQITVRYLAGRGRLHLRGMSLIDERTGTSHPLAFSTEGRFQLVHSGDIKIYENLDYLPRAFIVHRTQVVPDDEQVLAILQDPSFLAKEEAILSEGEVLSQQPSTDEVKIDAAKMTWSRGFSRGFPPEGFVVSAQPNGSTPQVVLARPVEIEVYQPERVMVRADLASEGYLLLSDAYYPGWRARVDGKEAEILRADYYFRAVKLPAGEHWVEFVYDPPSLKLGATISLATLLVLVGSFGWWGRKSR